MRSGPARAGGGAVASSVLHSLTVAGSRRGDPIKTCAPWVPLATKESQTGAALYARTVTTQIAIRLPDQLVAYLDETVARGDEKSRASFIVSAVEREIRHRAAHEDAKILASRGTEDDLDGLVTWTASTAVFED